MTRTIFDQLPNELVFKIFDYLTTIDTWSAFYNLNPRLNNALQAHRTNIDLSQCRKSQFDFACQCILKRIQNPFAIKFCPRLMVESTRQLFSKLQSKNVKHILQSLTLTHMTTQSMDIVVQHLNHLVNLRSLTIMHDPEKIIGKFIVKIMNIKMPTLTYLKLGYTGRRSGLGFDESNLDRIRSAVPNIQEFVLQVPITFSIFQRLLLILPQVVSIDVILMEQSVDEIQDKSYNLNHTPPLQKLVVTMNGVIGFKIIAKFLRDLPQLRTFWFSAFICDNSRGIEYQDGQVWEDLIDTYLRNLTDFRLNVGLEATQFASPSNVIQSFRSPFWTQEKKWWFVADRPNNDVDTIELYSLPPPTESKIIFRPNVQWASNSPDPTFKSVRMLGLLPTLDRSLSTTAKSRRYTNVTTIRPGSVRIYNHMYDVSIISDYVDLTKVQNCIINVSELIGTIPAMTNLTSLTIQCYDGDTECFKKIFSPILTLKKLFLSESMHCYYYNQNDLQLITYLFPNLEYVELCISEFESLPILMNNLSHLTYAIIYNEPEAIDEKHLKKWLHKNEAIMKFTWSLDSKRLDIWLD